MGTFKKRKLLSGDGRYYLEITNRDLATTGHSLKDVSTYRPCINLAVFNRHYHIVMGATKGEGCKIVVGIDADFHKFGPDHLKATQRCFVDCHKVFIFKIRQLINGVVVTTGEDNTTKLVVNLTSHLVI